MHQERKNGGEEDDVKEGKRFTEFGRT